MNRSARRAASFAPDTETTPESPVGVLDEPETVETPVEALADAPESASEAKQVTMAELQEAWAAVKDHQPDQAPVPYMPVPASQLPQVESPDIAAMVQKMMDEDEPETANADEVAAKISLESQIRAAVGSSLVVMPDGGVKIPMVIPAEETEILKAWAEGAGESFEDYLRTILSMALSAIITGGAIAG